MNSDTSMPSPESVHISVLLNEAVDALAPKAGGRYLDGTVGMGGHSFAIMERTGGEGFLCGLDRDTQALELARIRLAPFGDRGYNRRAPSLRRVLNKSPRRRP